MPQGRESVHEAVAAIQAWLAHHANPGEAVVRQAIVLRLLHAAGFDIWNPAEVVPEETNGSGNRSDFLIRAGAGTFALELKGAGVALKGKPYEQVVTYAAGEGTRWAMLTNGKVWVVLDRMHNPGGTFADHEVLKLELGQEGQTFADDLAALLDAELWRADAFASTVQHIKGRQQHRLDEARIRREKTAVVEGLMAHYRIPTFDLAADAATQMNLLTEAERDVLLGVQARGHEPTDVRAADTEGADPEPAGRSPSADATQEIHFTYRIHQAEAHAVYRPADGSWTVQAGSTLVPEVKPYATDAQRRREELLAAGKLSQDNGQLRYAADVSYPSPSAAARDISGGSKNGWDVWKDAAGRPAQFYRPGPPTPG